MVYNNNGNGTGEKAEIKTDKATLRKGSIENAFTQQEFPNAMKYLVDRGKEVRDILMRTTFYNQAERIAWMHIIAQCEEFEDWNALQEAYDNITAKVSERGMGRDQLVDAIIGDRRVTQQSSLRDKLTKLSGIGGDKKEQQ